MEVEHLLKDRVRYTSYSIDNAPKEDKAVFQIRAFDRLLRVRIKQKLIPYFLVLYVVRAG